MLFRDFEAAYRRGQKIQVDGVCGRIIRGKKPSDFRTLTDDPDRKLVMLMGPDGLQKMIGQTDYNKLVTIGYEKDYIARKVSEGNQFKLAVFGEGGPARLATWDNVLMMVAETYPGMEKSLQKESAALRSTSFAAIDREFKVRYGQTMAEVDKDGKQNPAFVSYDRFRVGRQDLVEVRAFLYFTVHLRELFSGDGYTYTAAGTRELMEYIVPNRPIAELGESIILDMDIHIPPKVGKGNAMTQTKSLPMPSFFDPKNAASFAYRPDQARILKEAKEWRKAYGLKPSSLDQFNLHLLLIDVQKDFCFPEGSLYVGGRSGTGAMDDSRRMAEFIYRNLGRITNITTTLDTHFAFQIFFAPFWVNEEGEELEAHSLIDIEGGVLVNRGLDGKTVIHRNVQPNPALAKFLSNGNYPWLLKQCFFYVKELKDGGKYLPYLWPAHCLIGSDGHPLVGIIHEARMFQAYTRRSQSYVEVKGGNALTENYSVLRPEVLLRWDGSPLAQKNINFLKKLLESDAVVIGGQAASHCVKSTIDDLLDEIKAADASLARKVYILRDCMSAVAVPDGKGGFAADFTPQAEAALQKFADAGMNVVNSVDAIESWPGLRLP